MTSELSVPHRGAKLALLAASIPVLAVGGLSCRDNEKTPAAERSAATETSRTDATTSPRRNQAEGEANGQDAAPRATKEPGQGADTRGSNLSGGDAREAENAPAPARGRGDERPAKGGENGESPTPATAGKENDG